MSSGSTTTPPWLSPLWEPIRMSPLETKVQYPKRHSKAPFFLHQYILPGLGLMVLFLSVLRSGTWPEDVSRSSQDGSWKDGHARGVEVPSRSPFPRNTFSCVLPVDPFV